MKRSEEYQGTIDNIINAGIKAMISENMGFDPKRIILLESGERDGLPVRVCFEVCGQGYAWDIEHGTFEVENAYGDRLFGGVE